jgi:hypothetical protein
MKFNIDVNTKDVQAALQRAASQVPFAASQALNRSAQAAKVAVQKDMRRVFDKPTPWVINSLRIEPATKTKLVAELAFKDKDSVTNSRSMVFPHVEGGQRRFKDMERRLQSFGYLPAGWYAVPGAAAKLNAYGNMSPGQITTLLNVLGTYTEAGYNKANARTVARLARGNAKKNQYGFAYMVVRPQDSKTAHLAPGVYQRFKTGFGSSLKPVLMFVSKANYRPRLDFYGIVQKEHVARFPGLFRKAFQDAVSTAIYKDQGSLL